MTMVRDTAAGKSISAYVILNKKGVEVARVQAHYANSGAVTVDVLTSGDEQCARVAKALGYTFDEERRIVTWNGKATSHKGEYAYEVAGVQTGRAGGYGYDKTVAALSGLVIDGHQLTNHCGARQTRPKGQLWVYQDKRLKKGFRVANYVRGESSYRPADVPSDTEGYVDAYREPGLDYLKALGYRVIQAI